MSEARPPLTGKEQEILDFMRREASTRVYCPTVREIGIGVNLRSSATVHWHLRRMTAKGYLISTGDTHYTPRSYHVLGETGHPLPSYEQLIVAYKELLAKYEEITNFRKVDPSLLTYCTWPTCGCDAHDCDLPKEASKSE